MRTGVPLAFGIQNKKNDVIELPVQGGA